MSQMRILQITDMNVRYQLWAPYEPKGLAWRHAAVIAEFSARCPGSYACARPPLGNSTRSCMCSTSSVRIWWGRAPLPKHVSTTCKMPVLALVHSSTSALRSLCSVASPSFRWWARTFSWFKPWVVRFVSFIVPRRCLRDSYDPRASFDLHCSLSVDQQRGNAECLSSSGMKLGLLMGRETCALII